MFSPSKFGNVRLRELEGFDSDDESSEEDGEPSGGPPVAEDAVPLGGYAAEVRDTLAHLRRARSDLGVAAAHTQRSPRGCAPSGTSTSKGFFFQPRCPAP